MEESPRSSPKGSPPQESLSKRKVRAQSHVQKNFEQISLDAKRTGAASASTYSPDGDSQTKVKTILEAWTVINPGMSYTQGMNEVALTLLRRHRGDVSKALMDLRRLAAPNALGGLWSKGMPLYQSGRTQLRLLLGERLPSLQQKLDDIGLDDSAYLPQAWHSLFAKWLPPEFAVGAVDDLLDHSMAAVLAITIAVLTELEEPILQVLDAPDAGVEVLLGPEGLFSTLRSSLHSRGESLRAQWQNLQRNEDISEAGFLCLEFVIGGEEPLNGLSRSMCDMVQQEAALRLATTASRQAASRQDDEALIAVFHKCKSTQDKAMRDEQLLGDHRLLFKCVVMGDSNVGKSQLVHCDLNGRSYNWSQNSYGSSASLHSSDGYLPDIESPTIGIDVSSKVIKINRQRFKLQIWDLSGNVSSLNVTRCYLHDMVAALFVYDISCRESFDAVQNWFKEFAQNVGVGEHILFLVGNKLDQEAFRQVSSTEAREFALQNRMTFHECSALFGDNVGSLFEEVAKQIQGLVQRTPHLPPGVRCARRDGSFSESILDRSDSSIYGRLDGCRRATGRCLIS